MQPETNDEKFIVLAKMCCDRIDALYEPVSSRRSSYLRYEGLVNEAAVNFYCGACAVQPMNSDWRKVLETWIICVLSVEGMSAVRRHAAGDLTLFPQGKN